MNTVEAREPDSWHAVSPDAALRQLDATTDGLTQSEAEARLARRGEDVGGARPESFLAEFVESLREPLQLLLIVVAVLSGVFGEVRDAMAIAVIIVAVALTETLSERRAANAIAALRRLSAPTARVRRAGLEMEIMAAEVVPGDVILVTAGDLVPADARVLAAAGLRVNESTLTGEAQPAAKGPDAVAPAAALAERTSMLFAGTVVSSGEATALCVATGAQTQLGRLGRLVAQEKEPPTPLQRAMAQLARVVLVAALVASIGVPLVGLLTGQDPRQMLLAGLALAFATVPEELPILVTVLLAVGGRQLARRGALLRRLRAGETLGGVTTVVTDKTGTLTENHLELSSIVGERMAVLAVAVAAAPDHLDPIGREPIETEFAAAARSASVAVAGAQVVAYPFEPVRKMSSRVRRTLAGGLELAVVGAPETVLARSALTPVERAAALADVDELTGRGLRVVAVARRSLDEVPENRDRAEQGLAYVGLAGFDDPVRAGVAESVAQLARAGVVTIVVSGDHPATVTAVARRAGLPPGRVLTGGDTTEAMTDEELSAQLTHGTVLARATPTDKLRVVRILQARREIVAVTGDGVNDGPALAAADVGIAMGRRGSDLARGAADLVLTDDAYPTVAAAIAKGRNLGSQLRRSVAFYLGAKLALVASMLIGLAAGLPLIFTPAAIVLLELFMDLGASVAFVGEPAAPGAMQRPPRPPGAGFFDRSARSALILVAAALTLAVLPAYLLLDPGTTPTAAQAGAVLAWLAAHALIAWSLRAQPTLSWRLNPAFPAWAAAAIVAGLLVVLTGVGSFLHVAALSAAAVATVAACVAVAVVFAIVGRRLLGIGTRL